VSINWNLVVTGLTAAFLLAACGDDSPGGPDDVALVGPADLAVEDDTASSQSDVGPAADGVSFDTTEGQADVGSGDVAEAPDAQPVVDTTAPADVVVVDAVEDVQGDVSVDGPCEGIAFIGCCTADGVAKYCNRLTDELEVVDCVGEGAPGCGWLSDEAGYYCTSNKVGMSDPSGVAPYLCPGENCTDACAGRECGYDCGQRCGLGCAEGATCSEAGRCAGP